MKNLTVILICIFFAEPSIAGTSGDSTSTEQQEPAPVHFLQKSHMPVLELSLWGGHAFDSFRFWGKTPDATLSTFGLKLTRRVFKIYDTITEYSAELNLYARYSYPEFEINRNRTSLSGFGFSPVGLQTNFFSARSLQPFLNTSAGLMFLERPFPDSRGEKTNFTFSFGGGLEFMLNPDTSLSLGYKYFHLSNGDAGEVNPGIDSSLLYTSLTFFM